MVKDDHRLVLCRVRDRLLPVRPRVGADGVQPPGGYDHEAEVDSTLDPPL
jgi:hypothetical protein